MRQQINLYQPIFSEARKPLSALTVATLMGVVAVCLIAFSVHSHLRVKKLAVQAEALRSDQSQQDALLLQASESRTARANPAEIDARVKKLTASLNERKHALQLLKSGAAGQTTGFAARLEALARRHVDGLWIDRLVISGSNGSMSLSGATLNAAIVPAYLQSLAQEPVLTGIRFDEFIIERPAAAVVVAAATAAAEGTEGTEGTEAAKPAAKTNFIRFRAGNKALDQKTPGAT